MRVLLNFLFLVLVAKISAQKPVIDTTNISYRNSLTLYYDGEIAKTKLEIQKIEDRKVRKQFLENYIEKTNNFSDLIKKGVFIEHKNYSSLIGDIFLKIKKGNPKYDFDEIKILLAISKEINAYNHGNGIVVVNLPLVYQVKNQMELAFIICHEISHQQLNHVYNSMLKYYQLENSDEVKAKTKIIEKQKYNKNQIAGVLYKKIVYSSRAESRSHEKSADSLGYIFFKNAFADYDDYAIETLKTLKTIDVAQDSLSKTDFIKQFEIPNLKFNNEWLASELSGYSYQKGKRFWNVDSLRTHPDCDNRMMFLKNSFVITEKLKNIDNSIFKNEKQNDNYEFVFGLYFLKEYGESLYFTLLNLKKKPSDLYFKNMVYNNLIKLQQARNNYTLNKYLEIENPKYSDGYNQYLCLIRNLRKTEITQLIEFYKP